MLQKHIFKTSIIFAIYLLVATFFNSCCLEEDYVRLKDIEYIEAIQRNDYYESTDTIWKDFMIRISFELEYIASHFPNLLPEAFAFQPCPKTVVNPVNLSSIEITLNKDFQFDNNTIEVGKSIQNLEGIHMDFYESVLDIKFAETFMEKALFEQEAYRFEVEMMNYDTIPEAFSGNISLFMEL